MFKNNCTNSYGNFCGSKCCDDGRINLNRILMRKPDAFADISGSEEYPLIAGEVRFYQTNMGVVVVTEINGLPECDNICMNPVFGYHIHEGCCCSGNAQDAFADARAHYNPDKCMHPYHAGDMPPLFGNNGYAYSVFLSNRFNVEEIIGRTVIIHLMPDDFHTQPSGDAGMKIACGMVKRSGKM